MELRLTFSSANSHFDELYNFLSRTALSSRFLYLRFVVSQRCQNVTSVYFLKERLLKSLKEVFIKVSFYSRHAADLSRIQRLRQRQHGTPGTGRDQTQSSSALKLALSLNWQARHGASVSSSLKWQ